MKKLFKVPEITQKEEGINIRSQEITAYRQRQRNRERERERETLKKKKMRRRRQQRQPKQQAKGVCFGDKREAK